MTDSPSPVRYGIWSKPGVHYTITYSLPAFHEVDFLVNEGYRRIPHGGIEHGGVLFGARGISSITIESFRQIECEHAAGPGFSLSPRDIEALGTQIRNSEADPELQGMEPLGWFVSYSRRDLIVSPAELDRFRMLFPHPWQAMFVVKPAKFKPTQFVALFPNQAAVPPAILEAESFHLPLPGREKPAFRVDKTPETVGAPSAFSAQSVLDAADRVAAAPSQLKTARKSMPPIEAPGFAEPLHQQQHAGTEFASPDEPRSSIHSKTTAQSSILAVAVAIVAVVACGCWFYLQYEAPAIKLHVSLANGNTVVTWSPSETSKIEGAELRFWTGETEHSVRLSTAERIAGRAILSAESSDITVELLSHHWLYDRRGMIRLLQPVNSRDTKR